ncbi:MULTISPECIES: M81 family metallopeptidase [unclassified Chelatococcus]|uniref:M81 family metallopeptidase n=1 Tax=unclassified Chelatococcus TaxID=2638111 RepID=UPI001BCE2D83|nr:MULTISPECIES: M81 family metallopeptidase [unclassified Chelatococcus]MBS7700924.1 M81 family metallopeptidase [Chelatococcus sp. YT9]MBX3555457.1 M81 family metallopeptidase [Chelatococcus sp.]
MTKRPRILLAALFHETHTFVEEITRIDDYTIRDVLDRRGDGSTVDGFLEVADEQGWEVVPAADFTALPSGTTDHAVFELFWEKLHTVLTAALTDGGLDGIWLALHGAMVTTDYVDPEGELLSRIRAVPGAEHLPLFGVFDLHANFTRAMADHANGLVAYRENPHVDARDSAIRSARLLARALGEGALPHMVTLTAPIMWPPTGTGTADRPMRDLEALAREIETETPAIWGINVVAGYSFSDTPDTGVSFAVITTADDAVAQSALKRLCALAIDLRALGLPREWNLDEAVARIKTLPGGPYVVVEPSDNIGGGAPGDGTAVLRAFLKHGLDNAAVAIADAAAVAALADASPGETRRLSLGGKGSTIADPPIEVDVRFVSRSDGNFTLEDRNSHLAASQGVHFAMGPSAVVTVGNGIKVLISSRKTPPFDLAQFRSQGIVPEQLKAIGVKAAVAHRRAYDPIAAGSFTVETAGPCTSQIAALPFRRLRPGVFPIHADWKPE